MEEFKKHEEEILQRTKRTQDELREILNILQTIITFIPKEECISFFAKAKKISPDKDDAPYFAVALKMNMPLWSNDKQLKEQKEVQVYTTKELVVILKNIS